MFALPPHAERRMRDLRRQHEAPNPETVALIQRELGTDPLGRALRRIDEEILTLRAQRRGARAQGRLGGLLRAREILQEVAG